VTTPEVDAYLAVLPAADRAALEHVRATIRAAAPDATEGIGYGIPVFRWHGSLIGYGATPTHCALYVMSPATLDTFRPELAGRALSKGTIQFAAEDPLPDELVTRIVKTRLAENQAARLKTKAGRAAR
jgi:uncharacterized protein YdhG (YjbR/CyaY superfamily)